MPEGLPYLMAQRGHMPAHWAQQAQQAQQYAAAAAAAVPPHQQYTQQYDDRAASMDATAGARPSPGQPPTAFAVCFLAWG